MNMPPVRNPRRRVVVIDGVRRPLRDRQPAQEERQPFGPQPLAPGQEPELSEEQQSLQAAMGRWRRSPPSTAPRARSSMTDLQQVGPEQQDHGQGHRRRDQERPHRRRS